MTVMFCGHADFQENEIIKEKMISLLQGLIKKYGRINFYFGGYGGFDLFALRCVKICAQNNSNLKTFFITPYIYPKYEKLIQAKGNYDECIYPELENVPLKFAIIKRNQWMVRESDIVVAYVQRDWGGAAKTLNYAKRLKKRIFNLALN